MLDRRARHEGIRLIETALSKHAADLITAPTLASLKAKKTRELGAPATASAVVPKVVSTPTT